MRQVRSNMKLIMISLLSGMALSSSRPPSEPNCIRPSPPPNDINCHHALNDMISDFDNYEREEGELTWVTRVGFVGKDYIVPKTFPQGEGADRCIITVDVDSQDEADQVWLEYMAADAFDVIQKCVEAKDEDKAAGRVRVGEKQVVVVTVAREAPNGGGAGREPDDIVKSFEESTSSTERHIDQMR